MDFKELIKPKKEKVILTAIGYFIFIILDILTLSPLESVYIPAETQQILNAPWIFWTLRTAQELITFYIISVVAYWYINLLKSSGNKTFLDYIKPNKINTILMLLGYSIFIISDTLLYTPIVNAFTPQSTTSQFSFALAIITLVFYLILFYLIGSFANWLLDYKK